jgi:thiamine biosynthesis protein ThiS
MKLNINSEPREFSLSFTLAEQIRDLDLPDSRIAVEQNRVVVRSIEWNSTKLQDDDRIEIVHFVGGGS